MLLLLSILGGEIGAQLEPLSPRRNSAIVDQARKKFRLLRLLHGCPSQDCWNFGNLVHLRNVGWLDIRGIISIFVFTEVRHRVGHAVTHGICELLNFVHLRRAVGCVVLKDVHVPILDCKLILFDHVNPRSHVSPTLQAPILSYSRQRPLD